MKYKIECLDSGCIYKRKIGIFDKKRIDSMEGRINEGFPVTTNESEEGCTTNITIGSINELIFHRMERLPAETK